MSMTFKGSDHGSLKIDLQASEKGEEQRDRDGKVFVYKVVHDLKHPYEALINGISSIKTFLDGQRGVLAPLIAEGGEVLGNERLD